MDTLTILVKLFGIVVTFQGGTVILLLRVMFVLGRLESRSADARERLAKVESVLGITH